jgi:hypothetical protein
MREWRKHNPLTPEQSYKDRARSYANTYQRRGKLIRQPCEKCGSLQSEKHHPDYTQPLNVEWLCRPCHLQLHRDIRETPLAPKLPTLLPAYKERRSKRVAYLKRQQNVRERAALAQSRTSANI